MVKFVITADTHGMIDINKAVKFFEGRESEYSKDDYLIICGDVGVCGFSYFEEQEVTKILRRLPVTTLFVDGNHENFGRLGLYKAEEWNGGKVHFIEKDIIHLMRGQVYNISGSKFFTFGGAYSIDRIHRIMGVTCFAEEIPSHDEYSEGIKNLQANNYKVDYILSHTAPRDVAAAMGFGEWAKQEIELRQYLQQIADSTDFTAWYFGHFHKDKAIDDKFFCVYNDLIEIGGNKQ